MVRQVELLEDIKGGENRTYSSTEWTTKSRVILLDERADAFEVGDVRTRSNEKSLADRDGIQTDTTVGD
jgi:hypothetical protein